MSIYHFLRRWPVTPGTMAACVMLGLVLVFGCGPPPTSGVVRGTVSIGGQPLPGGVIGFHAMHDASRWSAGQIAPDGTYLVPDAPLGPCTVSIDTSLLKDRPRCSDATVTTGPTPGGLPGGSGAVAPEPEYTPIREQFSSIDQSPLSAAVVVGENSFDFSVE